MKYRRNATIHQLVIHYCLLPLPQASLTCLGLAGRSKLKGPVSPTSFLAATTASLIAKYTATPLKKGGSPIPFDEYRILFLSVFPLMRDTLNSFGQSAMVGMEYSSWPLVVSLPVSSNFTC